MPFSLQAEESWFNYDHLYFQAGSYLHYTPSDDYAGNKIFTSLEAIKSNNSLYGLALFDNSFGQFSQYLYVGKSWNYYGNWEGFHTKLTAGLVHGYKGEFKDKIPFNSRGVAPAIIPGFGYKKGRLGADVIFLALNGLLFTIGVDF